MSHKMEGLKHTAKIREYCDYIDEHLINVSRAWEILQDACKDMNVIYDDHLFFTINSMIESHDLSKMSPEEFVQYQRNFYPFGEKDKSGFDAAWEHHKAENPHHWENWTKKETVRFPNELACHCVCMVCDWMAMGMKFNDTAQEYYEKNKDKIDLPDWAVTFLYEIFERIGKENAHKIQP